jgi:hypothetical protein
MTPSSRRFARIQARSSDGVWKTRRPSSIAFSETGVALPDVATRRLRTQGLAGARFDKPEDVVAWFGAMQSQEYALAKWSIGQRCRRMTEAGVDAAIAAGTILRTHVLRPTWHFVLPTDIRWMQQLTAPRVRAMIASYDRELELDDAFVARCSKVIAAALEGGRHLTRVEVSKALGHAGLDLTGRRIGHVMMYAELNALVCSGVPKGKQQTYALVDERVPGTAPLDRDEALAELAKRYFASHGPATAKDFRWWSSLTSADAKRGIEAAAKTLERTDVNARTYWLADPGTISRKGRAPAAHLLQCYDECIISYSESRELMFADARAMPSAVSGTLSPHSILLRGRFAGFWRRVVKANSVSVELRRFRRLARSEEQAVEDAVARYGKFVGMPARVLR